MVSFIPGGWKHKVKDLDVPGSGEDLLSLTMVPLVSSCDRRDGRDRWAECSQQPFIVWGVGPSWLSPSEGAVRGKF